ncbi:MAG: TRAP transporter small permease [Dehalobacterium sp.]
MEKVIFRLHRIGDVINTVSRVTLGVMSAALTMAVIMQLMLRWFGTSIRWATEFSCYIFVWTTMLGCAVASKHMMHIGVDVIINFFHGRVKKIIMIISHTLLLIALVIFTFTSWQYTVAQMDHLGVALKISMSWFYVSLPISGILMIYHTIVQLLEIIYYGQATLVPLAVEDDRSGVSA